MERYVSSSSLFCPLNSYLMILCIAVTLLSFVPPLKNEMPVREFVSGAGSASKDFFCGCNLVLDVDNILESIKPEDILTNEQIKDLESNLQSGNVLSNRMYLWNHRGFDPVLRKYYITHDTLLNVKETEEIIRRLEKILALPGTVVENRMFITEVMLPEVFIQWLQSNSGLSRFQAESLLLKSTTFKRKKRAAKTKPVPPQSTEEQNILLRDSSLAAEWCQKE
nr:uncharacterized protein LOC129415102 [Misgurnus anguillicaudatus]